MIASILNKAILSKEDAFSLLKIENTFSVVYEFIEKANSFSRAVYQNKGYIFA